MALRMIYCLFLLRLTLIFGISLDTFVECKIKNGGISKIKVEPDWSPNGAQRFIDLVKDKFYDGAALFRCQKDITVQFGIPKSREQMKKWHKIGNIKDDPKRSDLFQQSHWKQGLISFAGGGTDSRGGQIFVTLRDNIPHLGGELWETPFAQVIDGIDSWINDIYYDYGDKGGPDQGKLFRDNAYTEYLPDNFPLLSYMEYCKIIEPNPHQLHHDEHEMGHILSLEIQQILIVTSFVICCLGGAVLWGFCENKSNLNLKIIYKEKL